MLKVFLDANYIIYLKYSQSDEIFNYCIDLLKKLENYGLLTNIAVVNEIIWILNRKYGVDLSEVFEFLDRVLDFVTVISLGREDYEVVKEIMLRYKLKPSDAMHVASMKKAGVKHIVSEDPDFDRVEWIKRVWVGKDF
ncbi:MAG: PIN domain nuclease [Archaeoglobales archaeon]|nr:MAG: PIN domain nuclease [Archaeoglobales archaeon]